MGFIKDPIHKGNAYRFGAAFFDSHLLAATPLVAAQEMGLDGIRLDSMGFDETRWDPMGFEGIR